MTADDKQSVLLELIDSDPQKFISIVDDKHLEMKAKITIYLWMNIIRQLPNSSIIVDDNNKGIVAEWNAKYRSLKG